MCVLETHQLPFPKLEFLTLSNLDILFDCEDELLGILKGRRDRNIGLKKLVIRSCRVHKIEYMARLMELVDEVKWDNLEVVGSDYDGTDDDTDAGRAEDEFEDDDHREKLVEYHCRGCRC